MSGKSFHVHGPHDHAVEHAGHAGGGRGAKLAVMTAVLATVGSIFSYLGGMTQADAGFAKNNAAIKKTEAASQWNYYQAKSTKQNLSELAVELVPEPRRGALAADAARYRDEKAAIKAAAEKLESEAQAWDARSEKQLHDHHRWAQATTALQMAIALAAIALLTRRDWLVHAVLGVSLFGLGLGALAWQGI